MKIGVISDTHLDAPTPFLERVVDKYFKDVDLILHAGDICAVEVLDVFRGKKMYAVAGNNDGPDIERRFPTNELINVKGFKIGLTHGFGFPIGVEKRVATLFEDIDCLVFGHSHWPVNHRREGILFFNPGTFQGWIFFLCRRSIGLLTIGQDIRGEIVWL